MQLYNTLSAEERAIMIDDAGKQDLLCRMLMRKFRSTQFRNDLFRAWDPLVVLGRIYVAKEGINAQLSFLQIIFMLLRTLLKVISSRNAIEYCSGT
jgi:UPF0176 protein